MCLFKSSIRDGNLNFETDKNSLKKWNSFPQHKTARTMADTVNEIMDRMAPELHDLETNGIFSQVRFVGRLVMRRRKLHRLSANAETWNMRCTVTQKPFVTIWLPSSMRLTLIPCER